MGTRQQDEEDQILIKRKDKDKKIKKKHNVYERVTLTACLFVSPYIIGSYQTHYSIQDPRWL